MKHLSELRGKILSFDDGDKDDDSILRVIITIETMIIDESSVKCETSFVMFMS